MPMIDDNRLKGNYGAAVVMTILSSRCLVRPVGADTDIGVDLYCESVATNAPFLHFWVQVRAGVQCKVSGESASIRVDWKQVHYWGRQPVPVFVALVPTEWPPESTPRAYIVDLTRALMFDVSAPDPPDGSIVLGSHRQLALGDDEGLKAFIERDVPIATARLEIRHGMIGTMRTPEPNYSNELPIVPVRLYSDRIDRQIRRTAAHAVMFSCFDLSEETESDRRFRHRMTRLLETVGDTGNWENYFAVGLSLHSDGTFEQAVEWYSRSAHCIESDRNVCDVPSWVELRGRVLAVREVARASRPLCPDGLRVFARCPPG